FNARSHQEYDAIGILLDPTTCLFSRGDIALPGHIAGLTDMNDVRSKLTRILLLTAWLLATGSHWDVVQAFAWGRMLVTNAQVLPLRDALELTFSTDGRCDLCATVQEHRPSATDDEATVVNLLTREPLVFQTVPSVIVE